MKARIIGFIMTAGVLLLCVGCSLTEIPAGNVHSTPRELNSDGQQFSFSSNPILTKADRGHYSSDPAAEVVTDENGKQTLMLITSTDLEGVSGAWPMDGIHLYTTDADNAFSGGSWYEHGAIVEGKIQPIISQKDFWGKEVPDNKKSMFAPDIQYVPETGTIYQYIPYTDEKGVWQIGIAHAKAYPGNGQLYDSFTVEKTPFSFTTGKKGKDGFLIDPGVFHDIYGQKYYMTYVDTSKDYVDHSIGNISIAEMDPNMIQGTWMGNINFKWPYDNFLPFKEYSEGPDISVLHLPGSTDYKYYLVFSGAMSSNMIGYAMADPDKFSSDPATCWVFKGWIQQKINDYNNHPDLVEYDGHYYLFYHRGRYGSGNSRQVCCKEIELNPQGEIVGVVAPSDPTKTNDFVSPDASTPEITTNGFVSLWDSTSGDGNKSTIHIADIKNISGRDLNYFKLVYYITIEAGANMSLFPVQLPSVSNGLFTLKPLTHLGSKIWAVELEYSNSEPLKNGTFLNMDQDFIFTLTASGSSNTKSNDFSQPPGKYSLLSTKLAMFDESGDPSNPGQHPPICGQSPDIPQNTTKYVRSDWISWGSNGLGTFLNLTKTDENSGVNSRILNTGWTSQEWYLEKVTAMTISGKPYYFLYQDAVRIKNLQTAGSNYYMTCNDINKGPSDANPLYWVLNQKLRNDWSTQVWIKEQVSPGLYKLRCFWEPGNSLDKKPAKYPLYLTLNKLGDSSDVYCQPLGKNENGTEWASQHWYIE